MESKWSKVIIHASAFFAPYLVPIVFFLISDDKEVKSLSIQALLFQLVVGALLTISIFMSAFIIGIPFAIVFGLMFWGAPIIGIIKALNESAWRYPIVGRWV